jgi:hypothetical protein
LGGTVGVLLQRLFAFKLHYDDVFVALGKLHLDRLRPNILNTWIVDVLCRSYGPLDLFGRGYVPLSHPFVERLIGTIRREYLDRTLFWSTADLENKLLDFQTYFNEHRAHTGRQGRTPKQDTRLPRPVADLHSYAWQHHCRGLYHTPVAA